jgi:hypothetical protein
MHNGRLRLSKEPGDGDSGNPGKFRTLAAFAGKSAPQEKIRVVFRKEIHTV